jgi:hypothetical protein
LHATFKVAERVFQAQVAVFHLLNEALEFLEGFLEVCVCR